MSRGGNFKGLIKILPVFETKCGAVTTDEWAGRQAWCLLVPLPNWVGERVNTVTVCLSSVGKILDQITSRDRKNIRREN